jgi:hypothetical protein
LSPKNTLSTDVPIAMNAELSNMLTTGICPRPVPRLAKLLKLGSSDWGLVYSVAGLVSAELTIQ